jgi:hypothetical protein
MAIIGGSQQDAVTRDVQLESEPDARIAGEPASVRRQDTARALASEPPKHCVECWASGTHARDAGIDIRLYNLQAAAASVVFALTSLALQVPILISLVRRSRAQVDDGHLRCAVCTICHGRITSFLCHLA